MNRVGFILKPDTPAAGALLEDLAGWLRGRGDQPVVVAEDAVQPAGAVVVAAAELAAAVDMVVVLGGDGTMLYASNLVADAGIPVLGVNLGRLGFLSPFDPAGARDAIERALAGRLPIRKRMRLAATCVPAAGAEPFVRCALNDVVIHQSALARMIELEARLDGQLITRYQADGLIIATPTGSTAYNLAAGGPILLPGQAAMAITPICAHALTNRTLVVPKEQTISITILGGSMPAANVALTVDGQSAHALAPGDRVDVTAARRSFRIFVSDKTYFDILREKLNWGVRSQ
jgi:NAD+ kinase